MDYIRFTPERIIELQPNQVFVYGSNLAGINGMGAALTARQLFGARYGIGFGFNGNYTYAIPTKDQFIETLSLEEIQVYVNLFERDLQRFPKRQFLLTKVGCGLAGYSVKQIAPLFKNIYKKDFNIIYPMDFEIALDFEENGGLIPIYKIDEFIAPFLTTTELQMWYADRCIVCTDSEEVILEKQRELSNFLFQKLN